MSSALGSTNEEVLKLHNGKLNPPPGTLVEVHADTELELDSKFWYGEISGYNDEGVIVTYIDGDEDNIYAFQFESYVAPRESINRFVLLGSKRAAWKLLGFKYMGRSEIVPVEDVNSDESDNDWLPQDDDSSDDTSDEDESGDEEEEESGDEEEESGGKKGKAENDARKRKRQNN